MAVIPLWAVGRHVTTVTLYPQAVDSAGTLSDTTPSQVMFGHLESIEIHGEAEMENISAMDRRVKNEVIIEVGTTLRMTEFAKQSSLTNKLAQAYYGSNDYFRYVITRGGQSWTGYGIIQRFGSNMPKGSIKETIDFAMCDVGGGNPSYG